MTFSLNDIALSTMPTNTESILFSILNEQIENGLFPTFRNQNSNKKICQLKRIENIGLHTFVLEKLIDIAENNPIVVDSFQKGLDWIMKDAIEYDGFTGIPLWRWLKRPTRGDYLYPPDYDDIARARVIIEIAKKRGFSIDTKFLKFPFEELIKRGLSKSGGVYIFMGEEKRSLNRIDPMINANLVYSYLLHLQSKNVNPENDMIANRLRDYLSQIIASEDFLEKKFVDISRCYLSHNFFGYVISEINRIQPGFISDALVNTIEHKIETDVENINPLELAWQISTLINFGNTPKNGMMKINYLLDTMDTTTAVWGAYPIYQHRRLNHIFGSIDSTSIFCLEALKKYEFHYSQNRKAF